MAATQTRKLLGLPSISLAGALFFLMIVVAFYGFYPAYMSNSQSAIYWLQSAWNAENDYEHGWMVPLLSIFMLRQATRHANNHASPSPGSMQGLWIVTVGALLCILAVRTQQGRVAIGALPFLLTGLVWCYWGKTTARLCAFPFFFLWLSIPLPGFQQATVGMQLLATQGAHWGATLMGVDTIVDGTNIGSATGQWDAYSIAGGCSGMRSLMALLMISVAWAYLADKLALWKRVILGLSAIPLAIVANAFRVTSIFVCAEYINPAFAGKTWHDWSGLLFFFPASMLGLMILHSLLAGEIPLMKKRRVVIRRHHTPDSSEKEVNP